jgi:hypothetical protein
MLTRYFDFLQYTPRIVEGPHPRNACTHEYDTSCEASNGRKTATIRTFDISSEEFKYLLRKYKALH